MQTLRILGRGLANGATVMAAVVAGVALCEGAARLLLNPADYLSVQTLPDEMLGIRIPPNVTGFDAWGFRNAKVPQAADVVTIGDSHTFGNTVPMADSWPMVLSRLTRLSVYNLGLGGYGPNQYFHLLKTRALQLRPRWVFCALYLGDDFENAFSITYGLDSWASLRAASAGDPIVDANIWDGPEPSGNFKSLRNWLSANSITYRLVVHGPVIGAVKESFRFKQVERGAVPALTAVRVDEHGVREAFRPIGLGRRLDLNRPEIREGMRITFHLLSQMSTLCRQHGSSFAVVIIPTKETVFADYFRRFPRLHLKDAVDRLISNEAAATRELRTFLWERGILYVETLPYLRESLREGLYAETTADMHPGKNGYRVIAEAVADFAEQHGVLIPKRHKDSSGSQTQP